MRMQRQFASVFALAVVVLLVTAGCSGGSNKYVLYNNGDMRIMTVDGFNLIQENLGCDGKVSNKRSEGKMNETRTYVSWQVSDGDYHDDDIISFSADKETLTFQTQRGTKVYFQDGTAGAKEQRAKLAEYCSK